MGTNDLMLLPEDRSSTEKGPDGSIFRRRKYVIVGGYGLKTQVKDVEKTPVHVENGRKLMKALNRAWDDDVANPGEGILDFHQIARIDLDEADAATIQETGYSAKGIHQSSSKQRVEAATAGAKEAERRASASTA